MMDLADFDVESDAIFGSGQSNWLELLRYVKESRKLQSALTSKVPNSVIFCQNGETTRLLFIAALPGKKDNTIVYVDANGNPKPVWKRLVDIGEACDADQALTKEEQLLQERQRTSLNGISSFIFNSATRRVVFSSSCKLHTCSVDPRSEQPVMPVTLDPRSPGSKLHPSFCPVCPDLLAYVSNGDLWLYDLFSNTEYRLTHSKAGPGCSINDPISCGVPSYIIQEEFDRYNGYWWQPVELNDGRYRILYEEVDESDVEIINIIATMDGKGLEQYRYPRTGTANSVSSIKMIEISCCNGMYVTHQLVLFNELKVLYPWLEYIVRVDWLPDGKSVYAQILDRSQKRLAIIHIPLDYFVYDRQQQVPLHAHPKILHEELTDVWINVHNCLTFIPTDSDSDTVQYIWVSESTGYAHLYLHTYSFTNPALKSQVALTSGEWQILLDHPLNIDPSRKIIYFMANQHTPLEAHLYAVSYSTYGPSKRLTEPGYSHQVTISQGCDLVLTTYSNLETALASKLYKIVHDDQAGPCMQQICVVLEETGVGEGYIPPKLYEVPLENSLTYAIVHKPHDFIQGNKYPTVLYVYGGPHVQLVTNSNKHVRTVKLHTLAAKGYAVVCMDGRGSQGRGLQWEGRLKDRMGTVEIEDQVEGLMWLANHLEFIDLSRVAIYGWSYGGYISLMGLVQRPDIFKLCISCAPVTRWEYYDTGYTERYMSKPDENPEGYKNGSVLNYVDKFPNEENRLLLVHGMIDENVHLIHTATLVNELIKACKPYKLQLYPNERHGIKSVDANHHFDTMLLSFLQQHL